MSNRWRFFWRCLVTVVIWFAVPLLLGIYVAPSMPYTVAVVMVILAVVGFALGAWQGIVEIRKAIEAAKQFPSDHSAPPDAP